MSQANVPTTELNNITDISVTNTVPGFAVGGIVTASFGGHAQGISATVQADGKILLGGTVHYNQEEGGPAYSFATLMRYNSNGSLDLSFGINGRVEVGWSGYRASVTVQADGKILMGGTSGYRYTDDGGYGYPEDFALVRYNTDGSLDLSFDGDGKVTTDMGGNDSVNSITMQADGKILLGGTTNGDFALARYNSDGSLDLSFDGDGIVTTNLGGNGYGYGNSVTVQTDGKILRGGTSVDYRGGKYYSNFTLVRYNSDGSLDLNFDGDGIVTTGVGRNNNGNSVTVQTDGKILLGGTSVDYRGGKYYSSFTLVRYNSDGSLDLSFDGDGIVTTGVGDHDNGNSVTVQADGKILLAGTSSDNSNPIFTLVRYNTDGSLDLSFGINGIVTSPEEGSGESVAVQADGKILLGGTTSLHFDYLAFALVRYNSDGSLDNSFNHVNTLDGKATYSENGAAVLLDNTVQIYDAELAAQGNYNGASITLARHGGANAEDVFSGNGLLSFSGSAAVLSGVTIGTVSNSNGTLSINFNSEATQVRVDAVLSAIAYRNTTDYPFLPANVQSASAQIDWTFSDGNTGTQGTGEALTTTGASIINIRASYDYNDIIGTTQNDRLVVRSNNATKVYGFTGKDFLRGGLGNDTLDGGEGNDRLDGRAGADSMLGGLGDDSYRVDNESDSVIEKPDEGKDAITCISSYNLPANVENLTLAGSQSINGKGNDLANTLIGNAQDNRLSGGAGADTLSGGLSADIFKFNKATETGITESTRDTIVDFSHDQGDKINLAAIDANTAFAGNNAFALPTVGGAFSGVFANPGELYFDQSTHILYGNNDADSMADFSIMVIGVTSLAAADFVL